MQPSPAQSPMFTTLIVLVARLLLRRRALPRTSES